MKGRSQGAQSVSADCAPQGLRGALNSPVPPNGAQCAPARAKARGRSLGPVVGERRDFAPPASPRGRPRTAAEGSRLNAITDRVRQYLKTRTIEPLTISQLHSVLGGNRRTFYRAMRGALVDVTSGIVVVLEPRRQRGGHRRVWTLKQAVDAGLEVVLAPEALDA